MNEGIVTSRAVARMMLVAAATLGLTAALALVGAPAWAQDPFADGVTDDDVPTSLYPGEIGTLIIRSGDGLLQTERFRGQHRYETASLLARHDQNRDGRVDSDTAVIARADLFPDSLAGTYMAGQLDAPLLLVDRFEGGAGTSHTLNTLDDIGVSEVMLLGETAAIPAEVAQEFADAGYAVDRVGGDDRFDTARLLAGAGDEIGTFEGRRTAFLASGWDFPDALVSGAISYSQDFPVLLTTPDELHDDARAAIAEHDIEQILIPGGTSAVSQAVADEVAAEVDDVMRLAGPTRVETSIELARFAESELGFEREHVNFARADEFPDALALGPHSGLDNSILLLTDSSTRLDDGSVEEFLRDERCDRLYVHIAGGQEAMTTAVEDDVRDVTTANDEPCRISLEPSLDRNEVGDDHTVTATVTDNGFTPIPDVDVEFDTDTTIDPAQADPETATATTDTNGEAEFTFSSDETGEIEITAGAERLDGTPMSDTAVKRYALDAEDDFGVDKGVDETAPAVGDTLTFDVDVTNTSFMACDVDEIIDTLPEGFDYVDGSATGDLAGADVAVDGGDVQVVTFGFDPPVDLPVGDTLSGTLQAEVTSDAPTGVALVNVVDVISANCDDGRGESPPIEIDEPVDPGTIGIETDKGADTPQPDDVVRRGESVTYDVSVTNVGELPCDVPRVTDTLPEGFTFDGGSPTGDLDGASVSVDGNGSETVTFEFADGHELEPDETVQGTYVADIAGDAPLGDATNEATGVSDFCGDHADTATVTVTEAVAANAARADGYGVRADVGVLNLDLLGDALGEDLLGDLLGDGNLLGGLLDDLLGIDLGGDGALVGASLGPEPQTDVTLPPSTTGADEQQLLDLALPNTTGGVVDVDVATVSSEADRVEGTAETTSEASGVSALGGLVEADLIRAASTSSCTDPGTLAEASEGSTFTDVSVGDFDVPLNPDPNTTIELRTENGTGIGEVVINEVVPDSDGIGFTTRGLRITLDSTLSGIAEVEIVIAEAHSSLDCTDPGAGTSGDLLAAGTADFVDDFVRVDADVVETASPGDTVTYTLTVSNPGATPAGVFDVTDRLPQGLSLVDGSGTGAFDGADVETTAPADHQVVTFDLDGGPVELAPGDELEGAFQATVDEGGEPTLRHHDASARSDVGSARTGLADPVGVE